MSIPLRVLFHIAKFSQFLPNFAAFTLGLTLEYP